jgi:hypothetical protein
VLARLGELDGVARAEVDHAGDLLRLTLDRNAVAASLALLRELGHEAEVVDHDVATKTTDWYDATSVNELSFVEAGVIADRVVPRFIREHGVPFDPTTLRGLVVSALHRSFTERRIDVSASAGAFRHESVGATVAAVGSLLGPEAARAFRALLEADLSQDHRR